MAFVDQDSLATTTAFIQRVRIAMLKSAAAVQTEAATTLQSLDSAAAATSVTVVDGTKYAVNDLVAFGYGLATAETRKVTAIAANVLTVSALANAHKAGEVTQKVIFNHKNRSTYAALVLNSPEAYSRLFAYAIASDPNTAGININSLDADLQFTSNALFDSMAGVI